MLPQIVRDNKPERCDRTDFNDPSPLPRSPSLSPLKLFLHDRTIARSKVERVIFYERNATISKKMEYLKLFRRRAKNRTIDQITKIEDYEIEGVGSFVKKFLICLICLIRLKW